MKVAVLTMFNGLSNTYSLVNVVESHLQLLLDHDVPVKVLVSETCPDSDRFGVFTDSRLEWVKITNALHGKQMQWYDYSQPLGTLHESFEAEAAAVSRDLIRHLADVDVCMMHDILYQGWHYVHNIAVREAQKALPGLRFISFTHSLPVNRPKVIDPKLNGRFTPMPNTIFAYPTHSGIPALAKQYDIPEGLCRTVYNINPTFEFLGDAVRRLHERVDLLSPEILIVYPARFTRGKQHEKVAALAGAITVFCEVDVKVICCDFKSMDTAYGEYKNEVMETGLQYGLPSKNLVFTSDHGFEQGFPRKGVLDLFTLSNLFVCPSFSESFGLTVLEAASRGNFIVLNEAVPALEELGRNINAYFMRWNARNFGFDTAENYHPSELQYNKEHGMAIVNKMRENPVLHAKTLARTKYSGEWIWKNQLYPLLYTCIDS